MPIGVEHVTVPRLNDATEELSYTAGSIAVQPDPYA